CSLLSRGGGSVCASTVLPASKPRHSIRSRDLVFIGWAEYKLSVPRVRGPFQNLRHRPAVDDAIGGNAGQACVRDRIVGHPELVARMSVAVERKQAAGFLCRHRDAEVQILARYVA